MEESKAFWKRLFFAALLVAVLWLVKAYEWWTATDLGNWGILPQHIIGLRGIIFAPFIHGSFEHLSSNTAAILLLLVVLLNAYPKVAFQVLLFVYLMSGFLVWALTTPSGFHIGISGIIYGIASFLIASGVMRKDRTSTTIAILIALLYGSMAAGFFPKEGVSWQSHVWGAVSGIVVAFLYRNKGLHIEEIQHEPAAEKEHFFEE
jgi:membrane associated rhomboid family serine protease